MWNLQQISDFFLFFQHINSCSTQYRKCSRTLQGWNKCEKGLKVTLKNAENLSVGSDTVAAFWWAFLVLKHQNPTERFHQPSHAFILWEYEIEWQALLQCGPCSWKQRGACGPPASVAPWRQFAGDYFHPNFLPLLTWSPLLCEEIIDVILFAQSLKEGNKIEELGVRHVIKPGRHRNCVFRMEDVRGWRVINDDHFVQFSS